jgi:23S rRNA pseudouridine2605 synthase
MTGSKPTSPASRRTLSLKRDTPAAASVVERLHKVLAQTGLGSRRALEERISQGQVQVNGETASLGSSVKSGDRIDLDGKTFVATLQSEAPRVLVYNKPEGEVTTREDPDGRPTVFDRLPQIKGARWINVGRLDINTTGLLLLTTDGDLANALMHPSGEVEREYVCRVRGPEGGEGVSEALILRLTRGVELDDGPARFDRVERIGGSDSHDWFTVVVKEGRNREVRRLWESQGCQVSRLKRVRYGNLALPRLLKRGHFEELAPDVVARMRSDMQLAEATGILTLQPVIGQRRAKAAEYRPMPREQRAWTQASSYGDESREFRAFDNLREDRGGKGRHGKPGGNKPRGPRTVPDDIGNRLTAPAGGQPGNRRRKAAPGFENPAEHRSWFVPEGVTTTSRIAPPRPSGAGKPYGKPNPHGKSNPYGKATPYGERPGGGRGKPGGARPGSAPGKPGASAPHSGAGKPGGSRGPQGGKGAPRGSGRPGHGAPRSNRPR